MCQLRWIKNSEKSVQQIKQTTNFHLYKKHVEDNSNGLTEQIPPKRISRFDPFITHFPNKPPTLPLHRWCLKAWARFRGHANANHQPLAQRSATDACWTDRRSACGSFRNESPLVTARKRPVERDSRPDSLFPLPVRPFTPDPAENRGRGPGRVDVGKRQNAVLLPIGLVFQIRRFRILHATTESGRPGRV